jgi:hypothetical protein
MQQKRETLKGKTIFIVALITIGLTFLTVYLTGINYNRSLTLNLYLSLGIIAITLFLFLTYSLYKGTRLIDNYPEFRKYQPVTIFHGTNRNDFGGFDVGDGIVGILLSILIWIGMAILMVILLVIFEAIFWLSLFIIFASLYWVFIRALKVVLYNARQTRGKLSASIFNALKYTALYTGWLFGIALVVDLLK